MTQLLERAFAVASKLPGPEQDAFASLLLAELDSEQRWTAAFSSTQNQLAALADEALREFAAGQTQPMNLECDRTGDTVLWYFIGSHADYDRLIKTL